MSKFNIESRLDRPVCVELFCSDCGNKFSTELDINFKGLELPSQNKDVLYCPYCEEAYEYNLRFDNHYLEIIFSDTELFGSLKYSGEINLEEYKMASPKNSKKFYFLQIERLEQILKLGSKEHIVDQALNRLVYSGVITCLETYLSEIFTQIVFYSEYTLEKFISDYEPYKKEKIYLQDIFKKFNSLELKVKDDLENFLFHNISKLINIFNIYNFELHRFEEIKRIARYIQKRHHLVHRSGIDQNDNLQEVSEKEIRLLISDMNLFVEYIDGKINSKCFLPHDDLDITF
jgi:hypothetical protein